MALNSRRISSYTNMATVSLFRYTNMAAVTSRESTLVLDAMLVDEKDPGRLSYAGLKWRKTKKPLLL